MSLAIVEKAHAFNGEIMEQPEGNRVTDEELNNKTEASSTSGGALSTDISFKRKQHLVEVEHGDFVIIRRKHNWWCEEYVYDTTGFHKTREYAENLPPDLVGHYAQNDGEFPSLEQSDAVLNLGDDLVI
jgi:hypothetical protein